jgi:ketosteroid isomerase-like protein
MTEYGVGLAVAHPETVRFQNANGTARLQRRRGLNWPCRNWEESSMQPRTCLFSVFSIFVIAGIVGTVTAAAAEMDPSKCSTNPKQWQDAFNKGDTSAVAALYTSDAVEVTPAGISGPGPAAVKKRVDQAIKEGAKNDLVIVATKCDIEGAVRWSSGSFKNTSPQGPVTGFWTVIEVKDGDGWKMQNLTFNMTPVPKK